MAPYNASHLLLEEPIRLASILETSSHEKSFPSLTKIVGTLGPNSRTPEVLADLLDAGMTVARFDFSSGDADYHQETLEALKIAMKKTKRLCATMFDTVGPELAIHNNTEKQIELVSGGSITVSADASKEISSSFLPINYADLAKSVKPGDEIFVGQYLFTGSETTSVWLEVTSIQGSDVICNIKNSAVLRGKIFTAHVSQVRVGMPTLSEEDKKNLRVWGVRNNCDIVSLSFTRHADDVKEARAFLSTLGDLSQTQIYAKIENLEGLKHFDGILQEADGIILSRGNLGIDLPAEKVFLFQKAAIYKCNMAGKPAIITRVVDTMTDTPRPTRAEATDVANAVLDGADGILLGAETLRGLYPVETVNTVKQICTEAEKVYNQDLYFKKTVQYVGEPMSEIESICSSGVRAAEKVRASTIVVFTSSGRTARLVSKYKPSMPCLVVVVPRLSTNQLRWKFTGAFQARQCLLMRGLFPMLADPRNPAESSVPTNETLLKLALDRGKELGIMKPHDRIVVVQKMGESFVVKIVEIDS